MEKDSLIITRETMLGYLLSIFYKLEEIDRKLQARISQE